ncbi:hypothetical protein GCM10025867_20980 [Frondihabitans sucicola]|uniref:Uncharacterized protein n=1 Tax=Frondihabitans sucicola TaxID=1268041 RepID=A0ABN6XXU5_9MICO|nr:hypothetical protein GCM10025867_20980 [Frondihabitans sucicola]
MQAEPPRVAEQAGVSQLTDREVELDLVVIHVETFAEGRDVLGEQRRLLIIEKGMPTSPPETTSVES